MTGAIPTHPLPQGRPWECWRRGRADGALIGGLLNRLVRIQSTPYAIELDRFNGAILFWEELMTNYAGIWTDLHALRLAGVLDRIAGMVVGVATEIEPTEGGPEALREIALDVLGDRDIPVVGNVDIGHQPPNVPLPLGILRLLSGRKRFVPRLSKIRAAANGRPDDPQCRRGKLLLHASSRTARDVADPKTRLEAAALIEAMHARVLPAALHEDVVTIPGPGRGERRANHGASMAQALKIGMGDDVLEKAVPPSAAQEIGRGDQHAGCGDLGIHGGHEDRNAVAGQHFEPDLLGPFDRLRAGAHFRDSKEIQQRSKVGSLSKPGIGHLNTGLWIAGPV